MDLPEPTKYPFTSLPDALDVGTDPADGWVQIVYDEHILATHEPAFAASMVRLYLVRDRHGRLDIDGGELLDDLQRLQEVGYQIDGRHWAPFNASKSLEIVTLEGRRVGPSAMGKAIILGYELSRDAIDRRDI